LNRVRGERMSMIFQDPMTSLNPYLTIHRQMTEVLVTHKGMSEDEARRAAIAMLDRVQIPEGARRIDMYPHEFSGGMRQRAMIAMALLCQPELLIADEPTTALDVTIQAQILDLLRNLQQERGMALVLITHNMGVVSEMARRVAVMYAGQVMEQRPVAQLFADPQHPYTEALLSALPERGPAGHRLATIPGVVPGVFDRPTGCLFAPRCTYATAHSMAVRPELRAWRDGQVRCHYPLGDPERAALIAQDTPVPIEVNA
jgi:dipeptide transport system ATP-binding protein